MVNKVEYIRPIVVIVRRSVCGYTMQVYDWSSCIGSRSCVRTVLQSYAPSCPGPNKFTHYLQVDYQCIPREQPTSHLYRPSLCY